MDGSDFEELLQNSYSRIVMESMQEAYDFITSKGIKNKTMLLDSYIEGLAANREGFLEASLLSEQDIENCIGVYKYIKKVSGARTLSDAYEFVSRGSLDERMVHLWLEEGVLSSFKKLDYGYLFGAIFVGYLGNSD